MDIKTIIMCLTLIIYNVMAAVLVLKLLNAMNLREMLREKKEPIPTAGVAPAPVVAGGDVDDVPVDNRGDGNSYSRITGAVGSVVIAVFVWGLGTAVLYNAYMAPHDVGAMLTGIAPFVLSASALFAPYAFNQLSTVFPAK